MSEPNREPGAKKPYEPPKVMAINLRPEEAVLGNCKIGSSAGRSRRVVPLCIARPLDLDNEFRCRFWISRASSGSALCGTVSKSLRDCRHHGRSAGGRSAIGGPGAQLLPLRLTTRSRKTLQCRWNGIHRSRQAWGANSSTPVVLWSAHKFGTGLHFDFTTERLGSRPYKRLVVDQNSSKRA